MEIIASFQPAAVTDHITEDGHECTRLPWPMSFHLDGTTIDEWGNHKAVIGFTPSLLDQKITLWWWELKERFEDTGNVDIFQDAQGMYLVSSDLAEEDPKWSVELIAIDRVNVITLSSATPSTEES